MVAASGLRTLTRSVQDNHNLTVVAVSVAMGVLPVGAPTIYAQFPDWFQTVMNSGISAGALVAILLNVLLPTAPGDAPPGLAAHDAVREQPQPRALDEDRAVESAPAAE